MLSAKAARSTPEGSCVGGVEGFSEGAGDSSSVQRQRTIQLASRPPAARAMMTALPGAKEVTLPFWSTVATDSSLEVQVMSLAWVPVKVGLSLST